MQNATFAGHIGNDGSALIWGTQLGAELCDLGGYQGHGSWAVPHGILVTWALMIHGGIQLNALGERFHDETKGYSEAAVEVLKQPAGVAWCVFDESTYLHGLEFPDFKSADQAGAVLRFSGLDQLAQSIGCDVQKIQQTLRSIDKAVLTDKGEDQATGRIFKRALSLANAEDAGVYAVKVTGALFHTQGGLNIDENARVLKSGAGAFDNLYAAGGAARGVSGNEVWGYLSGNGLLSAFAGGYLAATSIDKTIKDKNSDKA
jgi:fumarate reductase flavoprotein subunit